MKRSQAEKFRRHRIAQVAPEREELHSYDELIARVVSRRRVVGPTALSFIKYPGRVAWLAGPIGAAKTTSGCGAILLPALLYPGTRWLVARWTYGALMDTTYKRLRECIDRIGPDQILEENINIHNGPSRILLKSALTDERGEPLEPSEIIINSLDNFNKQGSQEYTGVLVDEAHEIDYQMAKTLDERCRLPRPHRPWEQPDPEGHPLPPFFLRFTSPPVTRSHWLHRYFCGEEDCENPPWGKKFVPKKEENEKNLPKNYYEIVSRGMTSERKMRMIDGLCGPDPSGRPVYEDFIMQMHTGDLKYEPHTGYMVRGWDFGRRRPACVVKQVMPNGWVNGLLAVLGDNEMLETFAKRIRAVCAVQFPSHKEWVDYCDPHGDDKRDVTEDTSISIMRKLGFNPRYRHVELDIGIELVSRGLNTIIKGRPRSMYDQKGCAVLIEGFTGGYHYPLPRSGHQGTSEKPKPLKDGYYEHLLDAERYIEVNLQFGSQVRAGAHLTSLMKKHR